MEIELCGYKVQIDEEDYNRVMALKWSISHYYINTKGRVYFYRDFRTIDNKKYRSSLHRYIMQCTYHDGIIIDHINNNTLDNRKCNLRKCTSGENSRNQRIHRNSTTGYKGVVLVPETGKYRARIRVNRKRISLGNYNTPEEAYAAYCEGSKKYHGEFGRAESIF